MEQLLNGKLKIAVDWDGTCEFKSIQDLVRKLIDKGHYVQIVTTRYQDPKNYPFYRDGLDDNIHNKLFDFAKKNNITVHFTNMNYKADYLEENGFNVLIDDNTEEKYGLKNCQFIHKALLKNDDKMFGQ